MDDNIGSKKKFPIPSVAGPEFLHGTEPILRSRPNGSQLPGKHGPKIASGTPLSLTPRAVPWLRCAPRDPPNLAPMKHGPLIIYRTWSTNSGGKRTKKDVSKHKLAGRNIQNIMLDHTPASSDLLLIGREL